MFPFNMMDGWQSDDQLTSKYAYISLARITTTKLCLMIYFSDDEMMCARLDDRLDVSAWRLALR